MQPVEFLYVIISWQVAISYIFNELTHSEKLSLSCPCRHLRITMTGKELELLVLGTDLVCSLFRHLESTIIAVSISAYHVQHLEMPT